MFARLQPIRIASMFALGALVLCLPARAAKGCPFCRPVNTTFSEDIANSDVAALAELVERPERLSVDSAEVPPADLIDHALQPRKDHNRAYANSGEGNAQS